MALKKRKIDPMDDPRVKEITYFSSGKIRSILKFDAPEPRDQIGFRMTPRDDEGGMRD